MIVNAADLGYLSDTVMGVAHETAHKFSASDKYGGWGCIYSDGFVEPNKSSLYSQLESCLMCGNIPIAEKSVRSPADLSGIKICLKTAEEMRWK